MFTHHPLYITLFLLLLLLLLSSTSFGCPLLCFCANSYVDCSGKFLEIMPPDVPSDTVKLILDNTHLTSIPDVSSFLKLEELSLSNNLITSINASLVSSFLQLKILDLSHNKLQDLPAGMFKTGNHLEHLDVSHNNLSDISGLSSPLLLLKSLNLQNNSLSTLDVLRNNNQLPSLIRLQAGRNNLQTLETSLDRGTGFPEFPSLQVLELDRNALSKIEYWFTRFTALKKLVLSANKFQILDGSVFLHNDNLEELYLDHNELSSISMLEFTFKDKLKTLDLSYNQIHTINSKAFQSAVSVKYIDLSSNNLQSLTPDFLYHLQDLSYLNLHGNNIRYVSVHAFNGLNNLVYLNLSKNEISLGCKEFETVFKPLRRLDILDLNDNNILLLPSHSFDGLSALQTLYLLRNDIQIIEEDAFINLSGINNVWIETANLLCDCSIKATRKWITDNSLSNMVKGVCSSPPWVGGKNILNILDTELVCDTMINKDNTNRPNVIEHPSSKYAFLHGNTTLQCIVTCARNSPIHIEWYHESKFVDETYSTLSAQVSVGFRLYKRSSTLVLSQLTNMDGGRYWCQARNVFGSDWSTQANLSIVTPPRLSSALMRSITANSGETIFIPCTADGIPVPHIQFKKVGVAFPAVGDKRIMYKNHMFGIESLKIEDGGVYTCVATNTVGQANASIHLNVIEKPKFIRAMRDKATSLGSTAIIECTVSGNPTPTIEWYKDHNLVNPSNRIKVSNQLLFISSFSYDDVGSYTCQAANELGTTQQTANLFLGHTVKNDSTRSPIDVYVTVIVLTVIGATILTSLCWVALICVCRKRRRVREELADGKEREQPTLFSMHDKESLLLSTMPRNYVLRCNGQLVSFPVDQSTISLDPLLKETRDYLRQQQRGDGDDTKSSRYLSDGTCDDSGIGLVYQPYEDDLPTNQIFPLIPPYRPRKRADTIKSQNSELNNSSNIDRICIKSSNNDLQHESLATSEYEPTPKYKHYPARLKLHSFSIRPRCSRCNGTFTSDFQSCRNELHQSYVTSSSGVESGGSLSSENVSFNNGEVLVV